MKACVLTAPGAPLEVTEVPDPKAGPGEVVVRVKNCGICAVPICTRRNGAFCDRRRGALFWRSANVAR